jgi:FkbM family methyltransferase
VCVDIGANVGAFAVLAAKAGAEVVYAYEPEPENKARLEHHIKLNGVERQVRVLPLAVTDGSSPTVDMIGTGGGARITEGRAVVTTTLAEVIAMHGRIDYMKIDVEGAEGPMFAAVTAEDLIDVDRIGMEWHGPDGPPGHPGAPHLAHLTGEEFGPLVTKLADAGSVETFGHPRRGGLIHWKRYGA